MVRRRLATGIASALAALVCAAPAAASDASATSAYLRANYALVAAGHAHIGSSVAGYKAVLASVRRECPLAAAQSPQDPESTQLSNEVIGAMVLSAGNPDRPAIATFLRAASGLHWSSGSVTHAVSGYVTMLRKLYSLKVPDLCADVTAWVKSSYKQLPATTVSFDRVFYPNWVALGLLPAGLARFESGSDRQLAQRAARYEYQLTNVEAEAVETWGDIMNTLELNP